MVVKQLRLVGIVSDLIHYVEYVVAHISKRNYLIDWLFILVNAVIVSGGTLDYILDL